MEGLVNSRGPLFSTSPTRYGFFQSIECPFTYNVIISLRINIVMHKNFADKYYLVDSGYPNTRGYLAPYNDKSARYHMPNFRHGHPPSGIYETFNYRHSSLRTTIERAFGILKTTWKILRTMPQVKDTIQVFCNFGHIYVTQHHSHA
ncbi:hypothetical protein QQ045_029426 [Rhodiola kirilowii]